MSTTVTKAFTRASFGATLTPDPRGDLGSMRVSKDITHEHTPVASVRFRAYLGGGGDIEVDMTTGAITATVAGTRQVATLTITAAGGATANGNLTVAVTHPALAGSPLALTVPLRTNRHTTAALIAAAVREVLAGHAGIAELFTIGGSGAAVVATALHPAANEGSFAMAVIAGLGVGTAVSASTTAGVAGAAFEKAGGATQDLLGADYPTLSDQSAIVIHAPYATSPANALVTDGTTDFVVAPLLLTGAFAAHSRPGGLNYGPSNNLTLQSAGRATIDVLIHFK